MNSGSEEVLTAMEHQEGNKPESPPLVTSSTQASNTIESIEESTSLQVESTQDSASSTAHCSPVNSYTSMTKNAIPSTLLDNMCHLEFLSSNSAAGILPVNEDDVFMKEEPLEVVATDAVNLSTVTTAITNTDMTAKLPSTLPNNKSFTSSSCEVETALPVMSDDKLTTVEDEGSIQESMTTNNESNTSVTSSESCDSSKTAYTSAAFTSSSSDGTGSTESVTDTVDDNGDDGDDDDDDDDDDNDNDEDDNEGIYSTSSTSHYTLVQMYVTNSDNKLDSELSTKTVLPPDAWMYQQLDTATEASDLSATCLDCDSIIGDPEDCQLDVN